VRSSLLVEPTRSAPPPPEERSSPLVYALSLLVVAVVGYVGYFGARTLFFDGQRDAAVGQGDYGGVPEPTGAAQPDDDTATDALAANDDTAAQPSQPSQPAPSRPPAATPSFGRVLPFIDHSRGVEVADDQGLLVVEYEGSGTGPELRVGNEKLGPAPAGVALPGGRHELVIERDGRASFRFFTIRAGETRIVEVQ
jgi:hypothetical protein